MVDTEKIKALVLRAQDGDGDAFNELYNISCPMLRAVGMKYLHNPDDVSEILQDTYLRIHRSFIGDGIAPLREPEKFLPWSKKIMENLCKNLLDSRKRKPEDLRPETSDETQAGMDVFDNSDDDRDFSPEDAIETNYIRSLLEQKMSHVSPERQTCFALHQQGLTYREIAEQLSIPEGTVKSHVRYFRQQLQKTLKSIEKEENIQFHGIVPLPLPDGTIRYLVELEQQQPAHWIAAEKDAKPESKTKAPKAGIGKRVLWISLSVAVVAAVIVFAVVRNQPKTNIPARTKPQISYSFVQTTTAPQRIQIRPNQQGEPSNTTPVRAQNGEQISSANLDGQTSYGFFEYVGATNALNALNNSHFQSVMHKGDPDDATSLKNMLDGLDLLDAVNKKRAQEGIAPFKVTDTLMAMAQANCNYGAETMNHANVFNNDEQIVDSLAWGPKSPSGAVDAWFSEKENVPKGASNQWYIENWEKAGHYSALTSRGHAQGDTVAGAAYCFSKKNSYQYTYDIMVGPRAAHGEKAYTVQQYRKRLQNYIKQI